MPDEGVVADEWALEKRVLHQLRVRHKWERLKLQTAVDISDFLVDASISSYYVACLNAHLVHRISQLGLMIHDQMCLLVPHRNQFPLRLIILLTGRGKFPLKVLKMNNKA